MIAMVEHYLPGINIALCTRLYVSVKTMRTFPLRVMDCFFFNIEDEMKKKKKNVENRELRCL